MTLNRRQTLRILGGGAVLAAGAIAVDLTRGPAKAVHPWEVAGGYEDARMNALSYAILSPNPHNRQPWMVDLSRENEITLYVDTTRLLPHTDPFSRQITIGLGCFLETLHLACAAQGLNAAIDLFPDGEDTTALDGRRIAVVSLNAGGSPDALFDQVLDRRTQKEAYDTERPVAQDLQTRLESSAAHGTQVTSTNAPEKVSQLRNLSAEAFEIEFHTPRTYKESIDLFRIGRAEVNANPDGLDFSGPMFQALHRLGLFTREGSIDTDSLGFTSGLEMIVQNVNTAMAHIWLVTEGNSRADQIAAGRDWMRLNLETTREGIGLQPLSQALQEFPEMAEPYARAHKLLAPQGGTVQMWARLGYTAQVPPSPRWPIEKKILNG